MLPLLPLLLKLQPAIGSVSRGLAAIVRANPLVAGLVLLLVASAAWGWLQKGRADRLEGLRLEEKVQALEGEKKALEGRLGAIQTGLDVAERDAEAKAAEVRRLKENLRTLSARLGEALKAREASRADAEALKDKPMEELVRAFEQLGLHPLSAHRPAGR